MLNDSDSLCLEDAQIRDSIFYDSLLCITMDSAAFDSRFMSFFISFFVVEFYHVYEDFPGIPDCDCDQQAEILWTFCYAKLLKLVFFDGEFKNREVEELISYH